MAAYTEFSEEEIMEILSGYDIPFRTIAPIIGGMANTSYCINDAFILTALDNHDEASARMLTRAMGYLNDHNFRTPAPVLTTNDEPILMFRGHPILLKPFLKTTTNPTPELKRANGVGSLLAKLHSVPQPGFLEKLGRRIPENALEVVSGHKCDDLIEALQLIEAAGFDSLFAKYPVALCHGDLMGDNVLELTDGGLVAIDWETLTIDSTILDLGIAAVSAVKRNDSVAEFAQNLLSGYRTASTAFPVEHQDILKAAAYGCGLMAYHRFVRQNITFPNPGQATIYQQLLPFIRKILVV